MVKLAAIIMTTLLIASTLSQQAISPNMVSNAALTKYLNEKVLPGECVSKGFEKALDDISFQDLISYVIIEHRIPKDEYKGYAEDAVSEKALEAAFKTPNVVQTATVDDPNAWTDSSSTKNKQIYVYAVSNDKTIDYYRIEYHLNLQRKLVDTKEAYIGATIFNACTGQKEWIQKYQKA